jgi:hypothetical protein
MCSSGFLEMRMPSTAGTHRQVQHIIAYAVVFMHGHSPLALCISRGRHRSSSLPAFVIQIRWSSLCTSLSSEYNRVLMTKWFLISGTSLVFGSHPCRAIVLSWISTWACRSTAMQSISQTLVACTVFAFTLALSPSLALSRIHITTEDLPTDCSALPRS